MNGAIGWVIAVVAGLIVAWIAYPTRGARALVWLLAALRALSVIAVIALALDLPVGASAPPPAMLAFDASASWLKYGDTVAFGAARDSARAASVAAADVMLFGDSVRRGVLTDLPQDAASRATPAVQRAVAAGRRVLIVTDGALDDAEALQQAVAGSRVVVIPVAPRPDRALADIVAPAESRVGDTVTVQARVISDAAMNTATSLRWTIGGVTLADVNVPAMSANGEAVIESQLIIPPGDSLAVLTAALVPGGDAYLRNDSAHIVFRRGARQRVVIVSSAPDADVRDVIAVMRKNVPLPTDAFFRVAPGRWVRDGGLDPVAETVVRAAVRGATLAILHGDTLAMGAPANLNARALLLLSPPQNDSPELIVRAAPASPLQAALAGIVVESLPPLTASGAARGGVTALAAAQGGVGSGATPLVSVIDGNVRRVLVTAAGYGRWRARGGVSEIAFQSLFGGITDWLLSARGTSSMPQPVAGVARAGAPIVWRRGSRAVSVVSLTRDGDKTARVDTLAFASDSNSASSAELSMLPMQAGIWRGTVDGTPIIVPVSASREWLPRTVTLRSGTLNGPAIAVRRGARVLSWLYLAALLTLALEWMLRRRAGLR